MFWVSMAAITLTTPNVPSIATCTSLHKHFIDQSLQNSSPPRRYILETLLVVKAIAAMETPKHCW